MDLVDVMARPGLLGENSLQLIHVRECRSAVQVTSCNTPPTYPGSAAVVATSTTISSTTACRHLLLSCMRVCGFFSC
jgi:hypothetical protein